MAHWETPVTKLTDAAREKKIESINGFLFERSKKYETFMENRDVDSAEEALRLGYKAIKDGNYDESLGFFFSAIGIDEVRYYCLKGIGISLYHLGKYEDMITLFDVLLYSTPYDLTTRSYRIKGYNALRKELTKKSSLTTDETIALAHCHMTFDEQEEAFRLLDSCRGLLKPEDKLNLGIMCKAIHPEEYATQKKYFQEAVDSYEKISQNPFMPYYYLAKSHFEEVEEAPTEEGFKASIQLFNQSVKHNPLYRENYFYLSHAHKGLELYDKALNYINKAIEISDERITYYYVEKAYLQYQVNDFNGAIDTIVETESYDYEHGDSPYMKMLAGHCYYEMDELDLAEEWVNRARIAGYDAEKVERLLERITEERLDNAKSNGFFSGIRKLVGKK